jgi:transposase
MKFIQACLPARQGQDRFQTCFFSVTLNASVDENNEVRLIDLFVESLDISQMGFEVDFVDNGRPAYHPLHVTRQIHNSVSQIWDKLNSSFNDFSASID